MQMSQPRSSDLSDASPRSAQRTRRDVGELRPHPKHDEIYGDCDDLEDSFVESISTNGVSPLVTTPDGTIISGHRRWEAAKQLGMNDVPVDVREYQTDLERLEALLEFNNQREKSFRQKMREASEIEKIEREKAKQRQGTRTDLEDSTCDDDADYGPRREKIADRFDMSGRTYDKARRLWEAASEGDQLARHEVDRIERERQTIHGAWTKVAERHNNDEDADDGRGSSGVSMSDSNSIERDTDSGEDECMDETLDPEEMVYSAQQGRNADLFPQVLDLHVEDGARIADVTYGRGAFWEQIPADTYEVVATDIDPDRSPASDEGVDCRDLPYEDDEMDCVVLDPPYAGGFYDADRTGGDLNYRMKKKYGHAPDGELTYHDAVLEIYTEAAGEAYRVLGDDGVLIAKMQDEVCGGENHLTHIEVTNRYEQLGFSTKDLFVMVRPSKPATPGVTQQHHARKNHSYFMVYEC